MKRIVIGAAALVGAALVALPAGAADYGYGHGSGYGRPAGHHGYGRHHGRPRHARAYGRPLFDEGMPPYGVVVEYKPAYIGRGLVYNVPPRPTRAYGYGYGEGLRARY